LNKFPLTPFATVLVAPKIVASVSELVSGWFDQTIIVRLAEVGFACPPNIGGHIRRSFLGALSHGASIAAKSNLPCSWDPPCALDIFNREQVRGSKGVGLPKPYVIFTEVDGSDLLIGLRLFGMANDWFMRAAEALIFGIENIVPWSRLYVSSNGPPKVLDRKIQHYSKVECYYGQKSVRLMLLSHLDASRTDNKQDRYSILKKMLRRIDGISRWNGLALDDTSLVRLTQNVGKIIEVDTSRTKPSTYVMPSKSKQKRVNQTIIGELQLSGDLGEFWPILALTERAHVGRGAVEGMGRVRIL